MCDGILLLFKPEGFTSQQAISKVKWLLKNQGVNIKKIGHAGTLDPLATGLLVVLINGATKLSDYLMNHEKEYEARIVIGKSYDTEDVTGEIISQKIVEIDSIDPKRVDEILKEMEGDITQIPPMYSAIKHQGKKLYEYARQGKTVERKPRVINIKKMKRKTDLIYQDDCCYFSFSSKVSKGTYIRTLCYQLGEKLGYPAAMVELKRIASGMQNINNSFTIKDIELGNYHLINMAEALTDIPKISISEDELSRVNRGMKISHKIDSDIIALIHKDKLCGIYEKEKDDIYKARRVWN